MSKAEATTLGSILRNIIQVFPDDTGKKVVPQFSNNPLQQDPSSPFYLKNPKNFSTHIEYDPLTNSYNFQRKIGDMNYGPSSSMSIREYMDYDINKAMRQYWRQRAGVGINSESQQGIIPQIRVPNEAFEHIFGSNLIDIRPSGAVELKFGIIHTKNDNTALAVTERRQTRFDFDANIQVNLKASIGDKIKYNMNYSTETSFDFENKFKLGYEGKEDEILKLLEFGDVTLPLNSTLIQGSQTLFGVKTQMQFGKTTVTTVVSQQEGDKTTITVENGAEMTEFEFKADDYEDNRHFFLAQYFYDTYGEAMSTLPLINSKVTITRIEVWRTNIGSAVQENRNIIAFSDLGEPEPYNKIIHRLAPPGHHYPDSNVNDLLHGMDYSQLRNINTVSTYLQGKGMVAGIDFEKLESARLLSPSEYTFNSKLGFISLTSKLSADQVLAVAFQYTVIGDPNVYQVGQFANEVQTPGCIVVKLLKSTANNTKIPLWKLMMKNVYSLNAYQVSPEDFRLNVLYKGEEGGVGMGYFTEVEEELKGIPLIRLMGLDRLNYQQDNIPDGVFDFMDGAATTGGTVQSEYGRIFFPTVEPFGKDLREKLKSSPGAADKYAFDSLYTLTKTLAQQYSEKNKYYLEGRYKSTYGNDISLGVWNIAQGSVTVTAGGIVLTEGTDYSVDYNAGTVRILNENYLSSGTPINISVESDNPLGTRKTMFGMHVDYALNKDILLGATLLNLRERTETYKVNFGEEPINNTIWGLNMSLQKDARFITKALNYLPIYKTKQASSIEFDGEFAQFIPGHSRIIGKGDEAQLFVDDFESAKTTVNLTIPGFWFLASTPQHQTKKGMFPEAAPGTGLQYGFNRAKLAWYIIDPLFHNNSMSTPSNITADDKSDIYARRILIKEVFPYKSIDHTSEDPYLSVLNLAFYPTERGPYNYDALGFPGISSGLNPDGSLKDPQTRWGGIMRRLDNTDFESSNIEYIEFWLMDPFYENSTHQGGKLYINLGDISEDILRDGRKSFEHGLPPDGSDKDVDYTIWGRVPAVQSIVSAFDNDVPSRKYQDVGYDGLYDSLERIYFDEYLQTLQGILSPAAFQNYYNDPSADNFHFFRGTDFDNEDVKILERYKLFNNSDGNSPTDGDSPEKYATQSSSVPNMEDINNDNTLSEDERYYQYVIDLAPDKMKIGQNYIEDIMENPSVRLENGQTVSVKWYQFKIPIRYPDQVIGNISDFSSIRFMRIFLKGFSEKVICRFGTLELVRGDWRQYSKDLKQSGDYPIGITGDNTNFTVSTLNLEENFQRDPIPYRMPGGVAREEYYSPTNNIKQLNEQSLTMRVTNLIDGDARAVYKNTNFDFRRFKTLRFYLHAEKVFQEDELQQGDITFFIRLGSDVSENYYEYEIPLALTDWYVTDSALIWPSENNISIELQKLIDAKQERNIANRNGGSFPYNEPYMIYDGKNTIRVLGSPNLSDVNVIVMGVRNPKKKSINDPDDMLPKSVEIWVNELRLGNFEEDGGWAARANMKINLADLGDLSLAASISTPGFGALESTTYGRLQEKITTVDVATNLQLGKFLPEKWNVSIPFHYDFSRNVSTPEYNPLNPDVKLKEDIKTYNSKEEIDSIKKQSLAIIKRQNFSVVNVRKNKGESDKNRIWDIENFDVSYAYTEKMIQDENYEFDDLYTHTGGFGYNFGWNPKNYKPLGNFTKLTSIKWLQLLYDFNFYLFPKSFSFNTEMYRYYQESKLRNKSKGMIITEPMYVKAFEWARNYNIAWDITQSLKFDFTATAEALIDEPQGRIDTKIKKDSIWRNIGQFGKMNAYNHSFNVNYQIPINKIPLFSFISSTARYSATYFWEMAPPAISYLGNEIENSNTKQLSVNASFIAIYNKSKYLRKVNQGTFGSSLQDKPILKSKQEKWKKEQQALRTNKNAQANDSIPNQEEEIKQTKNIGKEVLDNFLRFAMMLKTVSFSYTENNGTSLPGFMLAPRVMGVTADKAMAPGFFFVFGQQEKDMVSKAAQNNWLTTSPLLNIPFMQRNNKALQIQASLQPLNDFRIQLTASRSNSTTDQYYFAADSNGVFGEYTRQQIGNFSITTIAINTLFEKKQSENVSYNFENFKANRQAVAQRLAAERETRQANYDKGNGTFPDGYGQLNQDVLLYSFIAAYMGKSPQEVDVRSPFFQIPLPNWNITYRGITKIPGVNKIFESITLSHAYVCTYQIGGYSTNLQYNPEEGDLQTIRDALSNFIPQIEYGQVAIMESMSPVISLDLSMKNSFKFKAEWRKSRSVTMSTSSFQISEQTNNEFIVGTGYRFKDLKITYNFSGVKRQSISDLVLNLDVSIRDNKTVLRKIEEEINQPSAGQKIFSINFLAEYLLTKNVSLKAYYDHVLNKPVLSGSISSLTIEAGFGVRINFAQM
ncbi:MAG: cell surface protein SprA [Bacteroidales bacterium]|nr:cell surface protein SprA [Bacteroidales bacterium]MDD4581002.1 cell surface protein SprA [Bacteroidales bacterium]